MSKWRHFGGLRKFVVLAVLVGLAWVGATSAATTYYVSKGGDDSSGTGVAGSPWASVTNALRNAAATDVILIEGGIYTQAVSFAAKSLVTIRGGYVNNAGTWTWDPANQVSVIMTTNGLSPIVIPAGAASNTLSYLTLRGGTVSGSSEAGIKFTGVATNTFVEGCTIISNYYGIYSASYWPQNIGLRNTLVARNATDGLYFALYNIGSGNVGGTGFVYNCTFADNGGNGLRTSQGNPDHGDLVPRVFNTIFSGNNGVGLTKIGVTAGGIVSNCLFHGNAGGTILTHATLAMGGNKTRYPRFVNSATNDYRLQSDSAAAAAGLDLSTVGVTTDLLGAPRPNGLWDLGAYESSGGGEGALVSQAYVATNGSDSIGTGTAGNPWATISYALGQVANGGAVYVEGGIYAERVGFGPDKQRITIRGGYTNNAGTWTWSPSNQLTVIHGNTFSPVTIGPGANSNVLSSLMLKGGTGSNPAKAGIEFTGIAPVLFVEGCTIVSNYYGMTAWYHMAESPTLRNTVIARSSSDAIYFYVGGSGSGTCALYNCTIADNLGNGFRVTANPDWTDIVPVARNCVFTGNTGYGLLKNGATVGASVQNCLFFNNSLGDIGDTGNAKVTNLGGHKSGRDPLFVAAANLNYSLQATSPGVAAGMSLSGAPYLVTNDLAGLARPQGAAWDMGAYESDAAGEAPLPLTAYVKTTGSDATGDGSSLLPWATPGYAVGHVSTSGFVRVAGGSYTGRVSFGCEKTGITLQGGYDGSWDWDPSNQVTTLFGNGPSPVVVESGADANTLSYLTLRGGTSGGQAGVLMLGSAPGLTVEGCTIISNVCGLYSGVRLRQNVMMRNTLVARNSSVGLYFYLRDSSGGDAVGTNWIYNCTIANNGGHGFLTDGNSNWRYIAPVAKNSLFTGNNGNGICKNGATVGGSYQNCLFYGNTNADVYSSGGAITDLGGNKTGRDPKYVNAATNDYRVLSDSPAAAAGTNLTAFGVTNDLLGAERPRPVGGDWDMGAYESAGYGEGGLAAAGYVRTSGNDTTGDGSSGNPWATINYALGHTVASGTVYVGSGTYGAVSLASTKKGAAIRGGYNSATWVWDPSNQVTTIDGGGVAPVTIAGGADSNALSYLTLRAGTNAGQAGILFIGSASNLIVESCVIVSNRYGLYSGDTLHQIVTMRNSLVIRNTYEGIYYATSSEGGRAAAGTHYLYNCTVADNGGSGYRTGVTANDRDYIAPVARNSIFTGNNGYGIEKHGGTVGGSIQYCLFYGNATGDYVAISALTDAAANKSGRDPRYVNASINDYRLQVDSPAAAAGTNLTAVGVTNDLLLVARPQGAAWDMGAYEGAGDGEPALRESAYVKTTGNNATGNGTTNLPWATIAYALGNTVSSGTVYVAAGTYAGSVQLGADKKNAAIRGGYDSVTWIWSPGSQATIVDGGGDSAVKISAGADSNLLSGLTLVGGTNVSKAGIEFLGSAANTFVEGCTIVSNFHGIYSPSAQYITLRNTLIARNASHGIGFSNPGASGVCYLYNCTVADNGGHGFNTMNIAADWQDIAPIARNSIFTGNNGYGIWKRGTSSGGSSISNCLFYGNRNGHVRGYSLVNQGNNKIRYPRFVDSANGDYRLQPDSPAAGAGMDLSAFGVTNDLLNAARPQGGSWDMGVYEGAGVGEGVLATLGHVTTNGSDATGDGTIANPWATIGHGLAQVTATGTLRVAAGRYVECVGLGLDKQSITIQGGYRPDTWQWSPVDQVTVIDGNGISPVSISIGCVSNTLSYLTLTGGTGMDERSEPNAGIRFIGPHNSLFVESCAVISNQHGVYSERTMPETFLALRNTLVVRSTSHGIFNTAQFTSGSTPCYLYNCTVADNGGHGIYSSGNPDWNDFVPIARNTLFTGNNGYGINKTGSGIGSSFSYCLFYGNASGPTNSIGNAPLVNGGDNLMANAPLYAATEPKYYQLQEESPALNSGENLLSLGVTSDIDGGIRPRGAAFDRGAYEMRFIRGTSFVFR
jgi:parallel beta-helix repeat protein